MARSHAARAERDTTVPAGPWGRPSALSAPSVVQWGTRLGAEHRTAVDLVLIATLATVLALPSFRWPLDSMDESLLLVYAEQVRSGQVPHRDFFTVYGPAPFYGLAGLFWTFGSSLVVERIFGLTLHVAVAFGCYAVGRSRDRATGVLAAMLSLTLMFPLGTVAYAWLGAMACLVGAVGLAARGTFTGDVVAGLLAGLCAAFRPEVAAIAVLALVPYVWRTRRWKGVLGGVLLGLGPLAVFAEVAGQRMWRNIVLGRMGVNGSLRLADTSLRSAMILTSVLLVTAMLVWLAWRRRTRASAAYAIVAVGLLPQTLQRVDPEHALYTLCITVPLLAVAVTPAAPTVTSMHRRRLLVVSMCIALMAGLAATVLRAPDAVPVRVGERSVLLSQSDAAGLADTRSVLLANAPSGGTVFVGSTDMARVSLSRITTYYLLPELRARGYYLELALGVSERAGSGLVDDLRTADVLVLSHMPDGLMGRLYPYIPKGSEEANEVVRREFCPVAETSWGVIYVHRSCVDSASRVKQMS